jgi:hypothetical protein
MELVNDSSSFGGSSAEPSSSATRQLMCFLIFYKILKSFVMLHRERTDRI